MPSAFLEDDRMSKSLYECRNELRAIITEIRDIEWGIRHDFVGIGQDLCGDRVGKVADKYDGVLRKLNNVDMTRLAEWALGEEE